VQLARATLEGLGPASAPTPKPYEALFHRGELAAVAALMEAQAAR
jgi:hypothetical protein